MADTKLADLTALTTPSGDDLLYVVDDPAGTPLDRKIALNNLFTRGTVTVSSPVIDAAQTWNAAVTFTGLKFNATDTLSAGASMLMDLQLGGSSKFNVAKSGNLNIVAAGGDLRIASTSILRGYGSGQFAISDGSMLTQFGVAVSNNFRFGGANAAAPVAQTLSVQSVVAGTTNTAGANLTITGSQGTGTGAGGSIIFQVAPAGSSGTAQNALAAALTINSAGLATFADAVRTSAPSGGTAANWKLGTVATVTPTLQNRTIEVDIGGTIYYLSAKTTND
jgi:hypothetical protein